MDEWRECLKGDPIPWLLESDSPSIRYWTLVDILERPADDGEVQEARAAIPSQALVQELFAMQRPEGYWGDDETRPHNALGAGPVLSLLSSLGVAPGERTAAGCDSFLKNCQHESGGFSMTRALRSGIFPCTTGPHLRWLVYFGFGDDPRVRAAFTYIIETMNAKSVLNCGRYQHQDCLWGAIAGLDGRAALPAGLRSERSDRVVRLMADALLDASYDFAGEHKRWLTLGVPRTWDLVGALRALAAHGYASAARCQPLLNLLLSLQDDEGRGLCGSVSRTWPLERRGRPSKWVTLDALRVLKAAGV